MNKGNLGIVIFGGIGCIIAVFITWLGLSMFLRETDTHWSTYGFFGFTIKGKTLAAILMWLGLVIAFYSIRKTIKYFKAS